ncbi:MAG: nicotinate phosphoribosyltransferase, partial [Selenomonas sp.]|nr:nicotinate phosphoribosyltransferase [Selenomonas sp.]
RVDSFGVGERLITAKSDPVFGAVYKLVAVEEDGAFQPRIKMSENVEKLTNPGLKDIYRIYDHHGKAVADMIAVQGEQIDLTQPFRYVDPRKPWKNRFFEGGSAVNLRRLYVRDGERVEDLPPLEEIREYVRRQLAEEIWPEEQRFENPHRHYLDMTPDYYELKMGLLEEVRGKHS